MTKHAGEGEMERTDIKQMLLRHGLAKIYLIGTFTFDCFLTSLTPCKQPPINISIWDLSCTALLLIELAKFDYVKGFRSGR